MKFSIQIIRTRKAGIMNVNTLNILADAISDVESWLSDYKHRIPVKDFCGLQTLSSAKHFLYARCDDVGFIVGGEEIEVVGKNGKYTEEEIETAVGKWWTYWRTYWELRGTKDAYPKDYACEITIPVRERADLLRNVTAQLSHQADLC